MSSQRPAVLVIAFALSLFTWLTFASPASNAAEKSDFLRELRAQNSDHLKFVKRSAKEPALTLEPNRDEPDRKSPWKLSSGPIRLEISKEVKREPGQFDTAVAILAVHLNGKQVARVVSLPGLGSAPVFKAQIIELDPTNTYPEVMFWTDTGGTHCCLDVSLVFGSSEGSAWQHVKAGQFDAKSFEVVDIDGDGRFEIRTLDNSFFAVYASYAMSLAPVRISHLQDGRLIDKSRDPRFRSELVSRLNYMIEKAANYYQDRNGWLAAYVAQKTLLGEGKEAWDLMMKYFDRTSDLPRKVCLAKRYASGECLAGTVKLAYPQALRHHLKTQGYPVPQ